MAKYGLVGKRLDYSFSKRFFDAKFENENLPHSFENIEIASVAEVETILKSGEYTGLTVTIPYKEQIIPYLDELSPEAAAIGAVNCVGIKHGKTIGYNTDAFGFHQSIKPFLTNQHERALILGTGGASKAVEHVLTQLGLIVFFASRSPKATNEFSYDEINSHMLSACKLVINTTPVGTFPAMDEHVPFPFEYLTNDHLVVDLIYNPEQTAFLKKARLAGATTLNGLSMLQEQALKAWSIWSQD